DLFLLAATNMVGEDTFYERAADRDARFVELVHRVTAANPNFIAGFGARAGRPGDAGGTARVAEEAGATGGAGEAGAVGKIGLAPKRTVPGPTRLSCGCWPPPPISRRCRTESAGRCCGRGARRPWPRPASPGSGSRAGCRADSTPRPGRVSSRRWA